MFNRELIRGVIPPLATPLTSDGAVDERGLRLLIRRLLHAGCHGMFILGGTGEGIFVTDTVYEKAIEVAVDEVAGCVPVLVGVSDSSTGRAIARGRLAARLGADVLISNPPYMGQMSPPVVYDHFVRLAGETEMPVMLYNVPPSIPTNITVETVARLAEHENIIGMKDSASYTHLTRVLQATRGTGFRVLCGVENFFMASMLAGAVGGTLASANVWPEISVRTYETCLSGDWISAQQAQDELSIFIGIAYRLNWVLVCKYALSLMGVCGETTVWPADKLTEEDKLTVQKWLVGHNLIN